MLKYYIFDYLENTPTAVWVINKINLSTGDTVKKSKISDYYFFADDCSDHNVEFADRSATVYLAGNAAFSTTKKENFYLDFPVGHGCRTFPGLLLRYYDGYLSIAYIPNYKEARKTYKTFANNLQNGNCSGTKNREQTDKLAVYHVKIPVIPTVKDIYWSSKLEDIAEVVVLSDPIVIR